MLDDGSDTAHPHVYSNAAELVARHAGLELLRLEDRLHAKPDAWHWQHVLAERT